MKDKKVHTAHGETQADQGFQGRGADLAPADFHSFDLDKRLHRVLDSKNIVTPTPIQAETIPLTLKGSDVIGLAQTGTGKTLAFALPVLTRLACKKKPSHNAVLILTPTRELANQVGEVTEPLAQAVGLSSTIVYGGVSLERQAMKLRKGRHVIVATPGRLLDHMHRGNVRFRHLEVLIIDEADRMLDMGFLPDIRRIIGKLPQDRQTLFFSATFPREIESLVKQFMRDPERVSVGAVFKPVDKVRQLIVSVNPHDKEWMLEQLLSKENLESALVFCRTKRRTESLARKLGKKFNVAQIHGDRSQAQRERALKGFRQGQYQILVATDVAARGLDIDGISHVVNFDIPPNADDYIHRIGRTARAQSDGDAITFVSPSEWRELEVIEKRLGRNLPRYDWSRAPELISMYSEKKEEKKFETPKKGRPILRSPAATARTRRRRRR